MPIVHIRHEEAPGAPVFAADGPLVETMPDVAPRHIEPVVVKHSPGAFTDTELSAGAHPAGVRSVVIAGFMTHMCCDTTARQAQERGLDVIFLTDGTATRDLTLRGSHGRLSRRAGGHAGRAGGRLLAACRREHGPHVARRRAWGTDRRQRWCAYSARSHSETWR